MRLFKSKSFPLLGLDISSSAVKLLEISHSGTRYHIASYAVEPVAPGAVVDKTVIDAAAVGESVRRAVKRSGTRLRQAAVAVGGSAVITKVISLPAGLSDEELASQIDLDADQYIPYPLNEVNLDFRVLGPSAKGDDTVDVLLAASRSENVEMHMAAVELGGLTPKIVDVEAYVTETVLGLITPHLPGPDPGKVIAVVDLGATRTCLSVLDDLRIVYTREHIIGGKQLTEEIQHRYDLTFDAAERSKKQGTLPAGYGAELLAPFKEVIAQQVSRSLQFFFSSSQYTSVDHIVLAGGNAFIAGIAPLIESKVGAPTSIANPFIGMSVARRINAQVITKEAPALIIACGLAMRSFD